MICFDLQEASEIDFCQWFKFYILVYLRKDECNIIDVSYIIIFLVGLDADDVELVSIFEWLGPRLRVYDELMSAASEAEASAGERGAVGRGHHQRHLGAAM